MATNSKRPSHASTSVKSRPNVAVTVTKTPTTPKSPEDDDNSRLIIISASVGGFLLLVILILVILYLCKRKKNLRNHRQNSSKHKRVGDTSVDSELFNTGRLNPGLQLSDPDIQASSLSKGEKRRDTIVCEDVSPLPLYTDQDNNRLIHDVSIKLNTPWNEIYTELESEHYITMKSYVQTSMDNIYVSYNEFESATLLQFRPGSVIADIRLQFASNAVEPLLILERAVKSGKCADVVVDSTFFQVRHLKLDTTDGFPEKVSNPPEEFQPTHHVTHPCTHNKRDLKGLKRESGYGSVESELQFKTDKGKHRECSTKSTESRDSVTSEIGTSYSVSTKSHSSTNSIHSCADEAIAKQGRKQEHGSKHKQRQLLDEPHVALFDFKPQDYRELALKKGDLVRVTYVDNGGWVKAINEKNVQGWVPHNFVTPIDPVNYREIKTSVEAISLLDDVVDQEIDNMLSSAEDDEDHYHVPRPRTPGLHKEDSSDQSSEDVSRLFVTIFPFDPSEKNELKLEVGDLIDVLKTDETGWWKGRCLRSQEDGWFPSSYLKPYTPELNFELLEEDKGTVSDSEVHRRSSSVNKNLQKVEGGYSSDNGESRTKKLEVIKPPSRDSSIKKPCEEDVVSSNGVKLRSKRGVPKERAVSLHIDIDSANGKVHLAAPLTPPPRLSAHRDHGNNDMFADPPSKPVPPKPRIRHIEKEYRNLVAAGKLGSTDSLKTVSTECLVSLQRSQINASWRLRRNSEEITPTTEGVLVRDFGSKPVNRIRPKSFQETPKNSFLYLANRYVNMKPAWSLPSLVSDQVKLSPDDDRPFLDPIPRKAKSKSFRDESSLKNKVVPERMSSSMKDLSVVIDIDRRYLDPIMRKSRNSLKSTTTADTYGKPITLTYENDKGYTVTRHENKSVAVDKQLSSSLSSSLNNVGICDEEEGVEQKVIPKKPLPPEPEENKVMEDKKPVIAPKPVLSSNSILSQLLNGRTKNASVSRPPLISAKPVVPVRTTSKNLGTKNLIDEHRSRQNLSTDHYHSRGPIVGGRLRAQRHFSSFESINEEAEQASTPKDENIKISTGQDHRRSRSEPHERILENELNFICSEKRSTPASITLSEPSSSPPLNSPVHITHDEKTESLAYISRASSLQSLTSIASSSRSTASSKHEQANLRVAIMNVHGQGPNDLSYNAGAILYELRPKNKQGLCFGILEDSTQGWFPDESVEVFQHDQF